MFLVAHAEGGVIDNAPRLATALFRVLDLLLSIFGFLAIIALVISGVLYFTAGGNQTVVSLAKKSFEWSILGVAIGLGSLVLVRMLADFFAE